MYAIIEACGRQYKVQEGEAVYFEKLDVEEGKKVSFDKVVLISNDGKVQVGNPYVANAKVEGKVVSNGKAKKILVFKYNLNCFYFFKDRHKFCFFNKVVSVADKHFVVNAASLVQNCLFRFSKQPCNFFNLKTFSNVNKNFPLFF